MNMFGLHKPKVVTYQQNLGFYNRGFIVFDTHLWILVACISGLLPTHVTCQNAVSFICVYELVYKLVTCQPCVNMSTTWLWRVGGLILKSSWSSPGTELWFIDSSLGDSIGYSLSPLKFQPICQWIGLRENLQETIDFPIQYGFPVNFPLNQISNHLMMDVSKPMM